MSLGYYPDAPPDTTDMSEYVYRQFTHISDETKFLNDATELLYRIGFERGIFKGSALITIGANNVLQNWDEFILGNPSETKLRGDIATGILTIGYPGVYRFTGLLTYSGAGTNQLYTIGLRVNGVTQNILSNLWTGQLVTQDFTWSLVSEHINEDDEVEITMDAENTFTCILAQRDCEYYAVL